MKNTFSADRPNELSDLQSVLKVIGELPVALSITDFEGNSLLDNRAHSEMFGYTHEEAPSVEKFIELGFPDEKKREEIVKQYLIQLQKAQAGKPCAAIFTRITCKDGKIKEVEFKMVAVDNYLVGIWTDLTPHKRMETAFKRLVGATSHRFGEAFFESMTMELSKIMDAQYTLIGKLVDQEPDWSIQTLAVIGQGEVQQPFKYKLADSPCETVVGKTACSYYSGVAEKFPKDTWLAENNIEGYLGAPLFSSSGEPIGIIAALYDSPLEDAQFFELLLRVFSARIASEIERSEAEGELQERIEELQRWHEVTLGREGRVHELKEEVNDLLHKMGQEKRYLH